nr:transposase [Pseudomonas cichorii]
MAQRDFSDYRVAHGRAIDHGEMANLRSRGLRAISSGCRSMIRIDTIWLAARRLNQGKFHWPGIHHGCEVELDSDQLQALVLGLPWQRVGAGGLITVL